jgi:hypothetical protein
MRGIATHIGRDHGPALMLFEHGAVEFARGIRP